MTDQQENHNNSSGWQEYLVEIISSFCSTIAENPLVKGGTSHVGRAIMKQLIQAELLSLDHKVIQLSREDKDGFYQRLFNVLTVDPSCRIVNSTIELAFTIGLGNVSDIEHNVSGIERLVTENFSAFSSYLALAFLDLYQIHHIQTMITDLVLTKLRNSENNTELLQAFLQDWGASVASIGMYISDSINSRPELNDACKNLPHPFNALTIRCKVELDLLNKLPPAIANASAITERPSAEEILTALLQSKSMVTKRTYIQKFIAQIPSEDLRGLLEVACQLRTDLDRMNSYLTCLHQEPGKPQDLNYYVLQLILLFCTHFIDPDLPKKIGENNKGSLAAWMRRKTPNSDQSLTDIIDGWHNEKRPPVQIDRDKVKPKLAISQLDKNQQANLTSFRRFLLNTMHLSEKSVIKYCKGAITQLLHDAKKANEKRSDEVISIFNEDVIIRDAITQAQGHQQLALFIGRALRHQSLDDAELQTFIQSTIWPLVQNKEEIALACIQASGKLEPGFKETLDLANKNYVPLSIAPWLDLVRLALGTSFINVPKQEGHDLTINYILDFLHRLIYCTPLQRTWQKNRDYLCPTLASNYIASCVGGQLFALPEEKTNQLLNKILNPEQRSNFWQNMVSEPLANINKSSNHFLMLTATTIPFVVTLTTSSVYLALTGGSFFTWLPHLVNLVLAVGVGLVSAGIARLTQIHCYRCCKVRSLSTIGLKALERAIVPLFIGKKPVPDNTFTHYSHSAQQIEV